MYRIKDDLKFYVEIYEWSGKSWEPYVADDVQVQFYMMSPYVLKMLSTDRKGLYHASFKVPDVYGVFQFKVDYHRLGYTSLSLSKQTPVRPFRHNEYERFITMLSHIMELLLPRCLDSLSSAYSTCITSKTCQLKKNGLSSL